MKSIFLTSLLLFFFFGWSQSLEQKNFKNFKNCTTEKCRLTNSFVLAEYFLETDDIASSQKWLEKTKDIISPKTIDTTTVFIHSLQSELFYYMGLFQFGTYEADKGIGKALQLKDSILIADAYFFRGINQLEMNEFANAEFSLRKSKNYLPSKIIQNHIRYTIQPEHVFNNLAQVKLKNKELDSAIWYNSKAYKFSLENKSRRGVPNSEQTFGQIYFLQNNKDSAVYYYHKSIQSAKNSNYYDIVLLDFGYMMECYSDDSSQRMFWFQRGLSLIDEKTINIAFQRIFYNTALAVFKKESQTDKVALMQDKIIVIDTETRLKGNFYIQNITEQYAKNENKLLNYQIEELKKQRKYTVLQLIAAVLCVVILLLIILFIRRKNRIQKTLLHQKNEISKDLHDDIGSGLSSILIHADLLIKNENTNDKEKILASKINQTGKEISQRLNTFIWSLNTEQNTLQDFCEYATQYAMMLFEETSIEFTYNNSIDSKELIQMNGHLRKNLFYALKEILNNSLKHANATQINLKIYLSANKKLELQIKDNGTGIAKENTFGNGFKNIKNRIEVLNGTVTTKNNNGLQIIISIPL